MIIKQRKGRERKREMAKVHLLKEYQYSTTLSSIIRLICLIWNAFSALPFDKMTQLNMFTQFSVSKPSEVAESTYF